MPIPLIVGGGLLSKITKKKKARREYEKWTAEFPVQDDCDYMEKNIQAAQERLVQEDKEFKSVKGIRPAKKAQQKRERDALSEYVKDMKDYLKDLKCGINISPVTEQPSQTYATPISDVKSGASDVLKDAVIERQPVKNSYAATQQANQNNTGATDTGGTTANTDTKSDAGATDATKDSGEKSKSYTKYVLIGLAVAAVAFIGYKMTKK
jgi:uncharacterized FlaG/YvyC family protein